MKKIVRLTEYDLTRIVKRIIIESDKEKDDKSKKKSSGKTNNQPSKSEILKMSEDELENIGKVKGEYLGKKGEFFKFRKNMFNDVVCNFRTDDVTPSGLRRGTTHLKVKHDGINFNK